MFKKIKRYAKDPYFALGSDMIKRCPNLMPDKFYLSVLWKMVMGYEIDWNNPNTFCEKIQWLKLYDHNPLYSVLVDKYRVKQWIADKIGENYVIPTLASYESVESIDWNSLPNQFVLKCNHDSGSVVICRDKTTFDFAAAKKKLSTALKHNFYWDTREWAYKNVPRVVIAEAYLSGLSSLDLTDYKWYCFNGKPVFCQVIQNRNTKETIDFFDINWEHQEFIGLNPVAQPAAQQVAQPAAQQVTRPADLMTQIHIAKTVSQNIPFSRIDLYSIGEATYFGEVTLYPNGGLGTFEPRCWDEKLGALLTLPDKK